MPDNRRELIKYRLESARERLNSAEVLLASKSYKDSIGRSYYAMFTACLLYTSPSPRDS